MGWGETQVKGQLSALQDHFWVWDVPALLTAALSSRASSETSFSITSSIELKAEIYCKWFRSGEEELQ